MRSVATFAALSFGAVLGAGSCAARPEPPKLEPSQDRPVVSVEAPERDTQTSAPTAGVPRVGRCDRDGGKVRFTLAHLNDLQARYSDRIAGRSRYAYVAGYLRALRAEVPETIVLDAGDDYEKGALAEVRTMGESTRLMIQALPIDARTLGNHDFAYGLDAVLRDVTLSRHPVLAANVSLRGAQTEPLQRFARIDVGCVKVGVVGLVTKNYGSHDDPIPDAYDGAFVHDDHYVRVLEEQVRAHRSEVDVMIALDHLGYFQDIALAGAVAGIDVYVGGHSEDTVKDPRPFHRKDGGRAYVLQAGHYGEVVGRADFVWDRRERMLTLDKHKLVAVDASLPLATDVAELADRLEREAAPDAHAPVAFSKREIKQGRPMAELVWSAASQQWGVDAMILGTDLFWSGVGPGPVTLQGLYDAVLAQRQPAGSAGFSSLYIVELEGDKLDDLKSKLYAGPRFVGFFPRQLDPRRTYRLAIEKRAMEHPEMAFGAGRRAPEGRYAGELIDVLEPYARARNAKKLALD